MIERAGVQAKFGLKGHPHKPRHSCGYAIANKATTLRYLGHKNIQHTVRKTECRRRGSKILASLSASFRPAVEVSLPSTGTKILLYMNVPPENRYLIRQCNAVREPEDKTVSFSGHNAA